MALEGYDHGRTPHHCAVASFLELLSSECMHNRAVLRNSARKRRSYLANRRLGAMLTCEQHLRPGLTHWFHGCTQGPEDTPYHTGVFIFDMYFPPQVCG